MRDIDREMDEVDKALAAEDAAVGRLTTSDAWRMLRGIVLWAVIALAIFAALQAFWH
jgi:hypothetical protein